MRSGENRTSARVSSLSLLFQWNYGPIRGLAPLGLTEDKAEDRRDVLGAGVGLGGEKNGRGGGGKTRRLSLEDPSPSLGLLLAWDSRWVS